ncbi:hypothetical protein NDU88_005589 [Pleurodeles waltl]|uniref:Uncharacterized protein n=1 Tax=Pleurodeles waltl TaxID=8319 RepID=A0AAV7TB20_PLEWA|nr:hypothetical protein NDU88_005589 [Pleurodeles waltl]
MSRLRVLPRAVAASIPPSPVPDITWAESPLEPEPGDQPRLYRAAPSPPCFFKIIIIIGDSYVGKTCLIYHFCGCRFLQRTDATNRVDFCERTKDIDADRIKAVDERGSKWVKHYAYLSIHPFSYGGIMKVAAPAAHRHQQVMRIGGCQRRRGERRAEPRRAGSSDKAKVRNENIGGYEGSQDSGDHTDGRSEESRKRETGVRGGED